VPFERVRGERNHTPISSPPLSADRSARSYAATQRPRARVAVNGLAAPSHPLHHRCWRNLTDRPFATARAKALIASLQPDQTNPAEETMRSYLRAERGVDRPPVALCRRCSARLCQDHALDPTARFQSDNMLADDQHTPRESRSGASAEHEKSRSPHQLRTTPRRQTARGLGVSACPRVARVRAGDCRSADTLTSRLDCLKLVVSGGVLTVAGTRSRKCETRQQRACRT
jgi:hypothetical protein